MTLLLDSGWISQLWCSVLFPTPTKRHSEFAAALIHTSHFPIVTATEAQEVFRAIRNTKLVGKNYYFSKTKLKQDPGASCYMKMNNEDVIKRKLWNGILQ